MTGGQRIHGACERRIPLVLALAAMLLFVCFGQSFAQLSDGGQPKSFTKSLRSDVQTVKMPTVDVQALIAEDLAEQSKDLPYRFGAPFDVNYSLENSGTWENLDDGGRLWRLNIYSAGAYSINLIYSEYKLPEGAQLFVYNREHDMVIGAFTSRNNKDHGKMATGLVKGDFITLEYYEPADVVYEGKLTVSRVVHAYKNLFDRDVAKDVLDFGESGSCNNNVICPVGDDWRQQIRSVAMITTGGGFRLCTGSMVNNVRQDQTPYFLTANHCLGGSDTWIFMFNYESPVCTPNQDGPTFMTVQGSTLLANSSNSDFALLELDETPPDSFNIFYNGWNAVNAPGNSACGIHHPSGDVKKISFDYDPYTSTAYLQETVSASATHWRITQWDDGTTEPGSSGSPLFDENHRVIGQLHGGFASCSSLTSDWYGKFAMSWNSGSTPSTRLKDWLDPDNTGVLVLDGYDPFAGAVISHTPLGDTKDSVNPYEVVATITSDTTLVADSLFLYWRTAVVWNQEILQPTANQDEYNGFIPAQSPGTSIDYYLEAHSEGGDADTTDIYSFRVIDYAVLLNPTSVSNSGAVADSIYYDFSVTNDGVLNDEYGLSIAGDLWPTEIMDASGTSVVTTTGTLLPDETFNFKVRVIVPTSNYGDTDISVLTAQSLADNNISETAQIQTISAGQPVSLPFVDTFPLTGFNAANWIITTGTTIDDVGLGEPSAPYSARFNGSPSGGDSLVSQAIDLEVVSGVNLSYYFEQTGGGESPDAGDDLIIEYFNDQGQWVELNRHSGDDPDMSQYQLVSMGLPADAYHSAFRLRFRNIGTSGTNDDWFVDDVRVDFGPEIATNPGSFDVTLDQDDSTSGELVIENNGQGGLTYTLTFIPELNKSSMSSLFQQLQEAGQVAPATYQYAEDGQPQPDFNLPKGVEDTFRGPEVDKNAGGPDGYGYFWIDSDEAGGPTYNWIDISTTGTDITSGLTDDNFIGPYPIGFGFPYYDQTYTEFYVGSNGIIGFGPTTNLDEYNNTPMPDAGDPNNFIAWCWDDLNILDSDNPGGKVLYEVVGGELVISFVNYPEYESAANPGDVITAQVILRPNGGIKIQYASMGAGFDLLGNTIGIENADASIGLQVSQNSNYIHPGLAIEFIKPTQWLKFASAAGEVPAGEADTISLMFSSAEVDTGVHNANLIIKSNDPRPGYSSLALPAQLTVLPPPPPWVCGDADGNDAVAISDAVYIIQFIFGGGPSPDPLESADADCSGAVAIADAVYIINFIFGGGPAPCASCP